MNANNLKENNEIKPAKTAAASAIFLSPRPIDNILYWSL